MNNLVMPLSLTPLASSASFGSMVQVFILVLFAFVVLLLFILLYTYISTARRVKRKTRLMQRIKEATDMAMSAASDKRANQILSTRDIYSRSGLAVLGEVYSDMSDTERDRLKTILRQIDIEHNLSVQLKSDNEDFLIELIHLASEMELTNLAEPIADILMLYDDNPSVQFEAFLTLSKFGNFDKITQICKDENLQLNLSFRSLQEILSSYAGDKPALYKELLASADAYITRVCIKEIGNHKMQELASDVEVFLDNENINLITDAMRTLSLLQYRPAIGKIKKYLIHERWEVRCVAVSALAEIDADTHIDDLIFALQDKEWQVRYNAGSALSTLPDGDGAIYRKVEATGDNFALDMMKYMTSLAQLGKGE